MGLSLQHEFLKVLFHATDKDLISKAVAQPAQASQPYITVGRQ